MTTPIDRALEQAQGLPYEPGDADWWGALGNILTDLYANARRDEGAKKLHWMGVAAKEQARLAAVVEVLESYLSDPMACYEQLWGILALARGEGGEQAQPGAEKS